MNEIFSNIYEVLPSKQTPKKYRSFFIKRDEGNVLIPCFSSSSTIEAHFDAMTLLGGLNRQLLGDSHFRTAHCDMVAARFNAPLYCSEGEAADVKQMVQDVIVLPFKRHNLDTKLEVIPTPGHRDGGVCYLIVVGDKQYLFVGDFIWHDGKAWIPTARKATTRAYIESLHVLEELEFDVLLANCQISNPVYSVEFDNRSRKTFINELLKQVNAS